MEDIRFVYKVTIGSINPNLAVTNEKEEEQITLLNKCLNDYPKGTIIGKNISFGNYKMGDHQITIQQTTYHIGFTKQPNWLTNK